MALRLRILGLWLLIYALIGPVAVSQTANEKAAMVVSVSSDGRYAVSSHFSKRIILWDLERRKKKVISGNANIYSAYFIKGQDVFIWQDLDDTVHVQTVTGETIRRFKHVPTYGHVMSKDLERYVSSDADWTIRVVQGDETRILREGQDGDAFGAGKLLNLSLNDAGDRLVSAGYGYIPYENADHTEYQREHAEYLAMKGVLLWDLEQKALIAKLPPQSGKTYATFSPDGQSVLTASVNADPRLWDMERRAVKMKVDWLGATGEGVQVPKGFDLSHHQATLWLGFIDNGEHFLRISTHEPYAVLYHVERPQLIKYIPLGERPRPSVGRYDRNAAFDTAPAAGILVTGQEYGSGINVYQYHPDSQTLELLWSPR